MALNEFKLGVEIKKNQQISKFYIYKNTFLITADEDKEIYASFNSGKTFFNFNFGAEIKEIHFSDKFQIIAILDVNRNVIILFTDLFHPYFKLGLEINS